MESSLLGVLPQHAVTAWPYWMADGEGAAAYVRHRLRGAAAPSASLCALPALCSCIHHLNIVLADLTPGSKAS